MSEIKILRPSEVEIDLSKDDFIESENELYAVVKTIHYIDYIDRTKYILKVLGFQIKDGKIVDIKVRNLYDGDEYNLAKFEITPDEFDDEIDLIGDLVKYQDALLELGFQIKELKREEGLRETTVEEYAALPYIHNREDVRAADEIIRVTGKNLRYDPKGSYYEYTFYNEKDGKTFIIATKNDTGNRFMDMILFYDRKSYVGYLKMLDIENGNIDDEIIIGDDDKDEILLN